MWENQQAPFPRQRNGQREGKSQIFESIMINMIFSFYKEIYVWSTILWLNHTLIVLHAVNIFFGLPYYLTMPGSRVSKTPAAPSAARVRANSFLTIPLEVRNEIYKHLFIFSHPIYIFQDYPSSGEIESFLPNIQFQRSSHHFSALLYMNRRISAEATAILYGGNAFQLMEVAVKQPEPQTPSLLRSFLDRIGLVNAGLLSYLCINFPAIEERIGEGNDSCQSAKRFRIPEDGVQQLQLLRKQCTGLRVLDMVYTGSGPIVTEAGVLQDILQEINTHLRAIPSLSKIVFRVIDRSLYPSTGSGI
jgi:hypothetical protein